MNKDENTRTQKKQRRNSILMMVEEAFLVIDFIIVFTGEFGCGISIAIIVGFLILGED